MSRVQLNAQVHDFKKSALAARSAPHSLPGFAEAEELQAMQQAEWMTPSSGIRSCGGMPSDCTHRRGQRRGVGAHHQRAAKQAAGGGDEADVLLG